MLTIEQGAQIAGQYLGISSEQALRNSRTLAEVDAFYYYQPVRGGGRVIVGQDGSIMGGISALSLTTMIEHFASGVRTDPVTRRAIRVEK